MKKSVLILSFISLLIISFLFSMLPVSAAETGPIPIHNASELQNIKNKLNADYILANDVDCSGINFKPISGFTGSLDGNGYSIKNMSSSSNKYGDAGLFDYASGAVLKNLKLVNVDFNGSIAAMVAYAVNCTFDNCSIRGSINGKYFTGGFAGILDKGNITHCSSSCVLSGTYDVGGLAGFVDSATISNCVFSGEISSGENTGGIVGYLSRGSVEKCSVTAKLTGSSRLGGIAGYNGDSITNSFFTGDITSSNNLCLTGGVVGSNYGTIDKCYSIPVFSGSGTTGGLVGFNNSVITDSYFGTESLATFNLVGYGNKHTDLVVTVSKTTEIKSGNGIMTGCDFFLPSALKVQSTFEDWDFTNVWKISSDVNNGYPVPQP